MPSMAVLDWIALAWLGLQSRSMSEGCQCVAKIVCRRRNVSWTGEATYPSLMVMWMCMWVVCSPRKSPLVGNNEIW